MFLENSWIHAGWDTDDDNPHVLKCIIFKQAKCRYLITITWSTVRMPRDETPLKNSQQSEWNEGIFQISAKSKINKGKKPWQLKRKLHLEAFWWCHTYSLGQNLCQLWLSQACEEGAEVPLQVLCSRDQPVPTQVLEEEQRTDTAGRIGLKATQYCTCRLSTIQYNKLACISRGAQTMQLMVGACRC